MRPTNRDYMEQVTVRRGRVATLRMWWPTYRVLVQKETGSALTSFEDALQRGEDLAADVGMTTEEFRRQLRDWRAMMDRWDRELPPAA